MSSKKYTFGFMATILALSLGLTACGTNNNAIGGNQTSLENLKTNNTVISGKPQASLVSFKTKKTEEKAEDKNAIRPFKVNIPEAELKDLRDRIKATRWPEKEPVSDQSHGVQLDTIKSLAKYWANDYDWRKVEKKLNSYPQFVTEIDGLDIHFIHVKSKHKGAMPIVITHGWPGSIIEQLKLIDPLTNPTAYGGKAEDAFDVVIPSMPGYGFSERADTTGWGPDHIAKAWDVLMKRLGYNKYVAQGGDWGALVTELMGVQAPKGLIGIHTNMPGVIPPDVDKALWSGAPVPPGLSADEEKAFNQVRENKFGYSYIMGTRPQTLTAMVDSPIGLASIMIDHDWKSYELISRVFAGQKEGLTRDDILDNITLFWLTKTGVSSSRLYLENKFSFFGVKGVTKVPVAVSVFPDELYEAPKSWAEKAYTNLIYYNKVDKGGHFAAWEQPALLTSELRKAFKTLR
ncbi:epoxide hydrolase family protein [Paenibacillus glycanilyticus]|uniref:epoxide hydrolase family protein n=1 Tax=Paenibacillus glycanilyticus TaxID=126569 RepID=UPI001F29F70D|nr:epoxide hydrolase family protein [Paenibacillus glycanilyticus]